MTKFLLLAVVAFGGCASMIGMDRYVKDNVATFRQMHDYEVCGGALPGSEERQDRCMLAKGYRIITPP